MIDLYKSLNLYLERKKHVIFETLYYDKYSQLNIGEKFEEALKNMIVELYLNKKSKSFMRMIGNTSELLNNLGLY